MADIEANVAITAQTDDLRSGMAEAADAVAAATSTIDARLMELGGAAQRAQDRIVAATAQIGASLEALQSTAAGLADTVSGRMVEMAQSVRPPDQFPGISFAEGGASSDADPDRLAAAAYSRKKTQIAEATALDQVSRSDEVSQLKDLLDAKWGLDQDYYERKLTAALDDAQAQQSLAQQQQLEYERYLTQRERLDSEAVQTSERQWQGLVQPIERALNRSVTNLILGTSTVQKALSNLAQSVVSEFVGGAVGSAFSGLGRLFGASLLGVDVGDQDFSGEVAGTGAGLLSGGMIGSLFKSIGGIFGFERGGLVPSAQSGWAVPQLGPGGVLARLHSNEMVLPADISRGLQSMIAGGGSAAPNITFAVSALDSQSVATFFKNNGATLVAAINRAVRNGSPLAGMPS